MREPVITRTLSLHGPVRRDPKVMLARLVEWWPEGLGSEAVAVLQDRMAELLGKEAALFFSTGTMAQQVAMRVHCDSRGRPTWTAHPTNHLCQHELDGHTVVHCLRYHGVADANSPLTLRDLEDVREPLGAVLWELPQREIGGTLPEWDDLVAQTEWASQRGAARHMDGARLWEAQPFYDRSHAEIAALFDTVYVSLYKGLEAPRGAVLAGSREIIDQAWSWSKRMGGNMPDAWPLAAYGLMGLDQLMPHMSAFRDHAIAIAAAINAGGVATTVPRVPQSAVFHVRLPVGVEAAEAAHDHLMFDRGVQLTLLMRPDSDPGQCRFEVIVGENGMGFTPHEVAALIAELVEAAMRLGDDSMAP